ncbi:MAG: alpha-galactosidase [Lachnospiraceae bacterium]|nr:alpha-galactosidase [Lachnospiraceae bacterium]
MVINSDKIFVLQTANTEYIFMVLDNGQLCHLHYGDRISYGMNVEELATALLEKQEFTQGNLINYDDERCYSLENMLLEVSSRGKGDIREEFICLVNADGSRTSDFIYQDFKINKEKTVLEGLPASYGSSEELEIVLKDNNSGMLLHVYFNIFPEKDVITRSAKLVNNTQSIVQIDRIMSTQVDFDNNEYDFIHFNGAWAREMNMQRQCCKQSKVVNESKCGTSSSRSNPFVMISKKDTTEDYGIVYGFNLIYSGNHYEAVDTNGFGKMRFVSGINPANFEYYLEPGETFTTPEAVMTFSHKGYNDMSHHMHEFIRNHIVRGKWQFRERPVLLNSWESFYFDYNESKIIKLAKSAKEAGIELFVLDDGWFGKRDNDKCSLGDWVPNKKKLPDGLKPLVDEINKMGLMFGIWVEPEMVNEDSDCFRNHPDWIVGIPGMSQSKGRNQFILDFTRKEVRDYIIESICSVLGSANIEYVKWDMNRIFSDAYSISLGNRQGEFFHRYILGLYEVIDTITGRFPNILFEGCCAGGNRFDLGILCYMQQIWASDNTDAICRAKIQTGYSYGYPMSVLGSHVSGCPNHQTLRNTSIETRFNVAAFGMLGYECNLSDLSDEDKNAIKEQIKYYKEIRKDMQFGDFYRISTGESNDYQSGIYKWITVSKDKNTAYGMILQEKVIPNTAYAVFEGRGLNEETIYEFSNRTLKYNVKEFGDLINTVAPVHIKQNSMMHNLVAKFVKMDGEQENYKVSGGLLCNAGIRLKQGFCATGYNENVRYFPDYASRLYSMKAVSNKESE